MEVLSNYSSCYDTEVGIILIPVQYCQFKLFNVKKDWGTADQSLIKPIILLVGNQTEKTN